MRSDSKPRSPWIGGLRAIAYRKPLTAVAVLVCMAGCVTYVDDIAADCLRMYPGDVARCCEPGDHVDQGTCCPAGMHVISDVEHPDWRICIPDETLCPDAGGNGSACEDAGADAP